MVVDKIRDALSIIGHEAFKGTAFGPAKYLSGRQQRSRRMNMEEMDRYYAKVTESKGFDVDGCTGALEGRILPLHPACGDWENAIYAAQFAAFDYYQDKRLESISLCKANRQPVGGHMYYLTFTAKNTKDRGRIQTFRAKVWRKPPGDIYELDFFEKFKIGKKPSTSRKAQDPSKCSNRSKNFKDKKQTVGRRGSALAGFRNFCKKIKTNNPSLTHAEATAVASERWKSLSIAEKKGYAGT